MSPERRTHRDEPYLLVRSAASDHSADETIKRHAHDWHQLVFGSVGVLTVWTERGSWVAPPQRAVWVTAGTRHGMRFAAPSRLRTLYIRPGMSERLPNSCCAVAVSPLLREMILRVMTLGMLDERDPAEAAMALLIAEELAESDAAAFELAEPTSAMARRAAELILRGAPEAESNAELARAVGLGVRTLERRFREETGMSPGAWRRQNWLLRAMERLAAGEAVKNVAADTGYASPSAFVAAFREAFGTTPGRYFAGG
jgi:AraC-like DNA-binding protein